MTLDKNTNVDNNINVKREEVIMNIIKLQSLKLASLYNRNIKLEVNVNNKLNSVKTKLVLY